MTEVISVKFKNRGKSYYFDPGNLRFRAGDKVIVETSKGLELADCCRGNHAVEDSSVIQPLRPAVRTATEDDLNIEEANRRRERETFEICRKKIEEHKLDMKLVDVECNFEGNKTLFFFTSDGRVDFRELVKDLAGIFRNRIELRQIGVRDEAKMLGGLGLCGQPYCCSRFLDDFKPVSTKMAKIQSLSLNPAKISGSCGRLMCCLRYEQEAYEDLVKQVPKQGAFVQTKDGYGTVASVDLLRQNIKVRPDGEDDGSLQLYKAGEYAQIPGGRPKEGEPYPDILVYVPPVEEPEEKEDIVFEPFVSEPPAEEKLPPAEEKSPRRGKASRRRRGGAKKSTGGSPHRRESTEKAGDDPQGPARGKTPTPSGKSKRKARSAHGKVQVKLKKPPEHSAGEKSGRESGGDKPEANTEGSVKKTSGAPKKGNSRSYRRGKGSGSTKKPD